MTRTRRATKKTTEWGSGTHHGQPLAPTMVSRGGCHGPWAPRGPTVVAFGSPGPFTSLRCFVLMLPRLWYLLWYVGVGCIWAFFTSLLNPQDLKNNFLLTCFGLAKLNYANTKKTSKITHNRRNTGINHIIKHINLQNDS